MKYRFAILPVGLLILSLLFASPAAGLARDNSRDNNKPVKVAQAKKDNRDDKKDEKRDDRKNDREDDDGDDDKKNDSGNDSKKQCLKAWGHLISPGWFKRNGQLSVGIECRLPFGIGKKFSGRNATTTPDITAPVISDITIRPAKKQAEVRWTTNEKATGSVFWSLTTSVDTSTSSSSHSITKNNLTKDHRIVIKDLTPATTYYLIIRSKDATGNTTSSEVRSFTTKAPIQDDDNPTISNVATFIGTTTIDIGWITDEVSGGRVYYSTTLPVTSGASFVNSASSTKKHLVSLSGLTPGTTYYLVIEAKDAAGNISTSAAFSAKTNGTTPPPQPTDTTAPFITASNINVGTTTAVVNWITNEVTTSKIYYGKTSPLDIYATSTLSALDTVSLAAHSKFIADLASSTQYYVIVVSTDTAGNISTSSQMSFITHPGI